MSNPTAVFLKLDGSILSRFMREVSNLTPNASLLRIFEHKNGVFSVHGTGDVSLAARLNIGDLRDVAQLHGPPEKSLRPMDTLTFNRRTARSLAAAALFSIGKKVELYGVSVDGSLALTSQGTPGNLDGLEESFLHDAEGRDNGLAGASSRVDAGMRDCTIIAVKVKYIKNDRIVGVASWDASNQLISMGEINEDDVFSGLESIVVATNAREAILCEDFSDFDKEKISDVFEKCGASMTTQSTKRFSLDTIENELKELVGNSKHTIAKILDMRLACFSCYVLLSYAGISSNVYGKGKVKVVDLAMRNYLQMDLAALRALNVFAMPGDSGKSSSIFGLLNCTKTAMGVRLLRRWLSQPLQDIDMINERLAIVGAFLEDRILRDTIRDDQLAGLPDINVICRRFSRKKGTGASLKDVVRLYFSVNRLPVLLRLLSDGREILKTKFRKPLIGLAEELKNFETLVEATIDLDKSAYNEFIISAQVNPDLSELRLKQDTIMKKIEDEFDSVTSSMNLEPDMLKLERKDHLGYVFRITRKNEKKMRDRSKYIVLETRKDGMRFQSRKLSKLSEEYEAISSDYEEKASETRHRVLEVAGTYVEVFQDVSAVFAAIDVLSSFAVVADDGPSGYCKPEILCAGEGLVLRQARHPIVEQNINASDTFVANDLDLRRKNGTSAGGALLLVTGPNMGGKSTYIRTAGVMTLLAHVGAYVPAEEARIPLTDRILTRVGASDDHHRALSTFMAEMVETASILKTATSHSLVIIDELGRGTGTIDGFGLAQAICCHISTKIKASCLFATHFYELTALATNIPAVRNFHVTAKANPSDHRLEFLYEVRDGACDKSFGVNVAEISHFPRIVLEECEKKAAGLESNVEPSNVVGVSEEDIKAGQTLLVDVLSKLRKLPATVVEESDEALRQARELRMQLLSSDNSYVQGNL